MLRLVLPSTRVLRPDPSARFSSSSPFLPPPDDLNQCVGRRNSLPSRSCGGIERQGDGLPTCDLNHQRQWCVWWTRVSGKARPVGDTKRASSLEGMAPRRVLSSRNNKPHMLQGNSGQADVAQGKSLSFQRRHPSLTFLSHARNNSECAPPPMCERCFRFEKFRERAGGGGCVPYPSQRS